MGTSRAPPLGAEDGNMAARHRGGVRGRLPLLRAAYPATS